MKTLHHSRHLGKIIDLLQTWIRQWITPLDHVAQWIPDGDNALELGCGQGILIQKIAGRMQKITGVDYDPRKCQLALDQFNNSPNITIIKGDILEYLHNTPDQVFDTIILADTLASIRIENQDAILEECYRVIQKNGTVILKIMDITPRYKYKISLLVASLVYNVLRLSISDGQQFYHRSSTILTTKLQSLGFTSTIIPLHQIHYNPLSHTIILGKK
ncbi:MAG: methyltransferase domain-containing protein [Magnetococcales bacterium]|nr:methyltransferase domain-containing protein [Magnetococcales bacterium]